MLLAVPSVAQSETDVKDGPGGQECVDIATTKLTAGWTCLGDELSFEVVVDGESQWQSTTVTTTQSDDPSTLSHPSDDDYSCEYKGICNVLHDTYTAWVKGNLTYGVSDKVWGRIDVVWRQHFNGKWPTWRLHLIWDSGYKVTTKWWRAQVRKEVALWPDPVLGYAYFYPDPISSSNWSSWSPSSTGWRYASEAIAESGNFHDDLYGYFDANGKQFAAGTLHTGHWKSVWNNTSKYWQQKYTSTWYS